MKEKQNKRARTGSFNFAQPKSEGGNCSQFYPKSLVPASFFFIVLQLLFLGMVIEIGRQDLSLRTVSAIPKLISFVRLVVRTTRVFAVLVAMSVLDMESQAKELEIVPSQVIRVSRTIPQLSPVAQIKFMLSSPKKIRKILLMWLLVCYKSFMCMFTLCQIQELLYLLLLPIYSS